MNRTAPAHRTRVAAFFDLDGTLIPPPSLERRLLRELFWRRAIPAQNFVHWALEGLWLVPRGAAFVRHANKMYLRGVPVDVTNAVAERIVNAGRTAFFPEAVNRLARHAEQGHRIIVLSGTLQTLADHAARMLQAELARRGIAATVAAEATRLDARNGRWTGKIRGEAMFGEAKACAVDASAARFGLEVGLCFAYGDSAQDRPMLERVGNPVAVNSSRPLRRAALRRGWEVVEWSMAEAGCARCEETKARTAAMKVESAG